MNQNRGLICSAVLASVSCGLVAQSAMADGPVVYSQLLPSYTSGFFADGVAGQYYSERIADDFTLGSATSVNGVIWAGSSEGFYYSDLTNFNSFRISIFSDAGGLPGAVLLDTTV
ncbi:MAG TPA: hypothetical protein VG711_09555, partial [Phycisphaerales bacterium]|nr:hypothetical protein [Phycisphaerales bacterium]